MLEAHDGGTPLPMPVWRTQVFLCMCLCVGGEGSFYFSSKNYTSVSKAKPGNTFLIDHIFFSNFGNKHANLKRLMFYK